MSAFATAADRKVLNRQCDRLIKSGSVPIAFYGAGRVLAMLRHGSEPETARFDEHIVGIIDDDSSRAGEIAGGLPIVTLDEAIRRGVKAVVITAEGAMQDAIWARRDKLLDRGIRVLCCPERFAGQTWDDCLIDHYEYGLARKQGINREYARGYPKADDRPDPDIRAVIASHLRPGVRVCEIGSGSGKWTSEFIAAAGEYHCVDYSARLLHEVIEHRFSEHRSKLHVHHDEHAKLPGVPDRGIDLLFSVDVFVHFKIDLVHQFLSSIRRVLSPDGVAVLHFAQWNDAGIQRWQQHDAVHHNGGVGPIHCVHMDWLEASARSLDLTARQASSFGWGMLVEFRPR